ncbi:MAG: hypothetical protein WD669_09450, partial [Pirellulales bacterium]
ALPGLIMYLIAVQVALFVLNIFGFDQQFANGDIHQLVALIPDRVKAGEVWRLVSFVFEPPGPNPLWAFFYWYLLYFFANTLEHHWGPFRLNLYLLVGWAITVLVAILAPGWGDVPLTNEYLYTSVFLAFALLYPDYELYIFFVLPVKVKWLAWLTWFVFAWSIRTGGWPAFWAVTATVANFLLFMGNDVWIRARHWWRGQRFHHRVRASQAAQATFFHECRVCGLTSHMAPRAQFRYCSKCDGQCCYCPEHLETHEHVVSETGMEAGMAPANDEQTPSRG